jgi:3-methyladenine DNA glycosylase/8-oxoguanine DNA glycosylase
MHVKINIDCTPEEARRFLGLPDLTPVHEAYIKQMMEAMTKGITPDMLETMMKSWGPMSDMGTKFFQQMVNPKG